MPSIERMISIKFRNPAHQLSANILASYLWRYLFFPSVSRLVLFAHKNNHFIFSVICQEKTSPIDVFTPKAFMQLISALRQFRKHFSPASVHSLMYVSKLASEVSLTNSVLISLVSFCVKSSSILWGTQADIVRPGCIYYR